MAVFYRTNAQARVIEEAMISRQIPHRIIGNISFFKRKEVKDLLAYIKLILNPDDSEACLRIINVPRRGIGKKTIETIQALATRDGVSIFTAIEIALQCQMFKGFKNEKVADFLGVINDLVRGARKKSVHEFIEFLVSRSGYGEMYREMGSEESKGSLEIIDDFIRSAEDFHSLSGGQLSEFADYLALNQNTAEEDPEGNQIDTVSLMTLHNAKGLEYPIIVMSGMDERFCPYYVNELDFSLEDLEEERRLMYVGMTRAKEKLYLTGARNRRLYGKELPLQPSRFIAEIQQDCIENVNPYPTRLPTLSFQNHVSPGSLFQSSGSSGESRSGFQRGDRVRHALWGLGLVLQVHGTGPAAKINISFDRAGVKKLKLSMANLTKIT